MERRRGRQEKTEETVVSSGWRGKDRKGFLFVYLTPPSFGQLPYILLRDTVKGEGNTFLYIVFVLLSCSAFRYRGRGVIMETM